VKDVYYRHYLKL